LRSDGGCEAMSGVAGSRPRGAGRRSAKASATSSSSGYQHHRAGERGLGARGREARHASRSGRDAPAHRAPRAHLPGRTRRE
jgi:hypothetical protein